MKCLFSFVLFLIFLNHCATIQSLYKIKTASQPCSLREDQKFLLGIEKDYVYRGEEMNPIYSGVRLRAFRFPLVIRFYIENVCSSSGGVIGASLGAIVCLFGAFFMIPILFLPVTSYEIIDFTASAVGDTLAIPITVSWKHFINQAHRFHCKNWESFIQYESFDEKKISYGIWRRDFEFLRRSESVAIGIEFVSIGKM